MKLRSFIWQVYWRCKSQIALRQRNLAAKREILAWSDRDEKGLHFYRQFLSQDSVCYDVGANVGNRSKIFARLAKKVIAIEPQRRCCGVLRVLQSKFPNVVIVPKATGSEEGHQEMYMSDFDVLSTLSREWIDANIASKRFGGNVWKRTSTVQVVTLDTLIRQYGAPDFVKIDVEGYEEQVLQGLSSPPTALSIEFVPDRVDVTMRCLESISRLGHYKFNFGLGEQLKMECESWVSVDRILNRLNLLADRIDVFGDIYARIES